MNRLRTARGAGWRAPGRGAVALSARCRAAASVPRARARDPGIVCTWGPARRRQRQLLADHATTGYVTTPDGNSIYMWSYGDGTARLPAARADALRHLGDSVTVVLHNTLPEATSIVFPGQTGVPGRRRPGPAAARAAAGADLAGPAGRRDRPARSPTPSPPAARDLPLRERHRRHQAAPDGPVRRPGRPPGRAPRLGQRPRRLAQFNPATSTCSCSRRSTPTCTWPSSAAGRTTARTLPPALLHDQRPEHAGHARAQQRRLAADPALRRAGPHPAVRRDAPTRSRR